MNIIIFWGVCGAALLFLWGRKKRSGGDTSRAASTRDHEAPPATPQPKKKEKRVTRRVKVTLTNSQWAVLRLPSQHTLEEKCSLILAARADSLKRQNETALTREA